MVGEVRDYTTELPIAGIAVRVLELDRVQVTDRNGFFAFDSIAQGTWTFEASGFGYERNAEASDVAGPSVMIIRLRPQPLEVEGLFVSVMRRLERRRLAVPSRIIAWEKPELEAAIAPDIGSFVKTRGVAQFLQCGGEFSDTDLPNCFLFRGSPRRLMVFIDDLRLPPAVGTSTLWAFDPRDLWTVEFLPGCGQLRIYTQQFMRLVEDERVRLVHVIC